MYGHLNPAMPAPELAYRSGSGEKSLMVDMDVETKGELLWNDRL